MSDFLANRRIYFALGLLASSACSDAPTAAPGAGGNATTQGGGGAAGSPAAAAGAPSAGSAGIATSGGGAGASGAGGAGSNSGGAAGSVAPGGGAGGGGGAGLGGASAGNGGAAGGDASLSIAAELNQFRLECPCSDPDHFGTDKQDNCDQIAAVDRQTHVKTLGGDPNVVYDVKLHVRGNTEPNTYTGGKLEQNRFYIGGQTSTPGYTAYMLSVGQPKQVYFFNYNPTTGHIHFLIDYEVVIPMQGGTTVTFEVNGGKSVPDGHGVSNREQLVVPDIPPAPNPFNGQLVQFDVMSVQPRAM
jgi:hypothetical protein